MKNILQSSWLRTLSTLMALMLAIPLAWNGLTGFFTWLSPFIMLNSTFALKSFVWLNLAASVVLIFVLFRKRWFCNNLCPVGWGCDKIAGLKKNKAKSYTYIRLPFIGKWLSVISLASALVGFPLFVFLDPMAIFNGFFTLFAGQLTIFAILSLSGLMILMAVHLFFPGIWCKKLCPLGGFQLVMNDLRLMAGRMFMNHRQEQVSEGLGRRYFLMSGLGLAAGLAIPDVLKQKPLNIIRPPAAVEPSLLLSLCSRCGSCNKVCPTGIIVPYTGTGNILMWMTPEVIFSSGYCLETCNLCSIVCPTGAITLFDIRAKSRLFMGTAVIHLENCLLFNNTECVKCKESCKYGAIDFVPQENNLNMIPAVSQTGCVGCGACEIICPEGCIKIKSGDSKNQMTGLLN